MTDNEKYITKLEDGELAVKTVAQTGDIINDRPADKYWTALVQTQDGPSECVKVFNLNGGGGGGGGTTDYEDLTNQPQINGNTLIGNKTGADLGLLSNTATGTDSLTINGTATNNQRNVNIGAESNLNSSTSSVAVGYKSKTWAQDSIALGANAYASGLSSVAIGSSGAQGYATQAQGYYSNAIGFQAVATQQDATQIGRGTNTVAGSLQFRGYQLVDNDGNIPAARLNKAAVSTTFLENKMGKTFDVSTLGTIKGVYRNGVLQRTYTDMTKKTYNATGSQQYVKIDKFIDFNSADNWCISFFAKNSGNWGDCRIMSNALADHTTPVFTMDTNRLLHLYLSSDGTSWSFISNRSLNLTLENRTDYYLRLGFTGTKYYFDAAKAGGTWQRYDSFDSTTKIYSGESNSRISFLTTGWESGGVYISSISFSPQDLQIFTNNQNVFNGLTAVQGTDWSNVNANETVTTAPSNEGYKISGTTLELSEELLPPETLAIESIGA